MASSGELCSRRRIWCSCVVHGRVDKWCWRRYPTSKCGHFDGIFDYVRLAVCFKDHEQQNNIEMGAGGAVVDEVFSRSCELGFCFPSSLPPSEGECFSAT